MEATAKDLKAAYKQVERALNSSAVYLNSVGIKIKPISTVVSVEPAYLQNHVAKQYDKTEYISNVYLGEATVFELNIDDLEDKPYEIKVTRLRSCTIITVDDNIIMFEPEEDDSGEIELELKQQNKIFKYLVSFNIVKL
jgi:hypothetical protein